MAKLKLKNISPSLTEEFKDEESARSATQTNLKKMYERLYLMFAESRHSLLIILQGIDASGKDGAIRTIFSGSNPQGMRVFSFKKPTPEELQHDFLWRCHKHVPECGFASVFNRSYYEEVTTTMVHPEYLKNQNLPDAILSDKEFFEKRYHRINDFEKMLSERGTVVLKFFLHISKDEQKKRLKERLKDRTKNWKFSEDDIKERKHWDKYMIAFEKMINNTDTKHSPWHVVPADKKWYRDYLMTKQIVNALNRLEMHYPKAKKIGPIV
jgi:PPK2 family polyphosphate:nucleotide phosphotransferase